MMVQSTSRFIVLFVFLCPYIQSLEQSGPVVHQPDKVEPNFSKGEDQQPQQQQQECERKRSTVVHAENRAGRVAPLYWSRTLSDETCAGDDPPPQLPTETTTSDTNNDDDDEDADVDADVDAEETTKINTDDILRSFLTSPTKGQHLMLVPRDSPYKIRLDENVAYRLRQNQEVHNTNLNSLLYRPSWTRPLLSAPPEFWESLGRGTKKNKTSVLVNDNDEDDVEASSPKQYVPLLLESHPGRAIVSLSNSTRETGFMMARQDDYRELGIGDERDALQVLLLNPEFSHDDEEDMFGQSTLGRRFLLQTKDNAVFIVSSYIGDGAPVTLTSLTPSSSDEDDSDDSLDAVLDDLLSNDYYNDERCHFVINADGTLSSILKPKLAIGISPFPVVTLVPRDSANRFLFRHVNQFWSAPAPVDGVPLELASHPGLAIVPSSKPYRPFSYMTLQELGVGAAENALRLYSIDYKVHHQFLLTTDTGDKENKMTLLTLDQQLERGSPLRLIKYSTKDTELGKWFGSLLQLGISVGGNATWIVNDEGSISPLLAPGLAIGCEYAPNSRVNQLLSARQQHEAQVQTWRASYGLKNSESESASLLAAIFHRLHIIAYISTIGDGILRQVLFLCLFLAITVVSLIPYPVWVTLLIAICFGKMAALTFAIFEITSAIVTSVIKFFKLKPDPNAARQLEQQQT